MGASLIGIGATTNMAAYPTYAVASFSCHANFGAVGAQIHHMKFNYDASWSVMIYGDVVLGAGYDPTTTNMRVWFTGQPGQWITIGRVPFQTTQAIEGAPSPQAYVLNLIRNAPPGGTNGS